nr:MAG TPA: Fis1 N-terminal tetratricopeptide repeat [Caudoviricetes sp.]
MLRFSLFNYGWCVIARFTHLGIMRTFIKQRRTNHEKAEHQQY